MLFYNLHQSVGPQCDGWTRIQHTCDFCRCHNWWYSGKLPNSTHSFWSIFLRCHHHIRSLLFVWYLLVWLLRRPLGTTKFVYQNICECILKIALRFLFFLWQAILHLYNRSKLQATRYSMLGILCYHGVWSDTLY